MPGAGGFGARALKPYAVWAKAPEDGEFGDRGIGKWGSCFEKTSDQSKHAWKG